MKKLILLGAFLLSPFVTFACGGGCANDCCQDCASTWCQGWTIEGRVGYLWFVDDDARDIYDQGGAEYELEIGKSVCDCVTAWGNVNYFTKDGHSIGLNDPSSLHISTLSGGLKLVYPLFNRTNVYVGAGGLYSFYRGKDKIADRVPGDAEAIIHESTHKNGLGFVSKLGLTYCVCPCVFFDLFADYYYQKARFHFSDEFVTPRKANYSNIRLGGGIGYAF